VSASPPTSAASETPPPPQTPRVQLAVGGLLTGLAGLAASLLTASVLHERLSPPYAVAEAIVQATPGQLAVKLVHLVGRWDKTLLVGGVLVGLVVLSAVAGLLCRRRALRGQLVFLAFGVVALVATLTQAHAQPIDVLPVVVGTATWLLLLPWLTTPRAVGQTDAESRRTFLRRGGLVVLGTFVAGVGSQLLGRKRRVVEAARSRLKLPVTAGKVPRGAQLPVEGLGSWRVSNSDFYRIDTALVVPAVDSATWRLRIHGMVDKEVSISYQDILDRQLTEAWVTICCVSNEVGGDLIGNAWWSGIRVADLLAEAGPHADADAVLQTSDDGWTCGTPLAALTDGRDAMLAIGMNGRPLPLEHGFPVRMIVPGLYGFVSACKWVVDLKVTRFDDFTAFWTERGWSAQAPIKTESRIDVPGGYHRVTAGKVPVAGVAWAQHTGIERVEVRLDGGPWQPVNLGRVPSVDTWVQWSGTVDASPGVHHLAVRATDRSGYTQTGVRRDVVPNGATGWHTIEFTAE